MLVQVCAIDAGLIAHYHRMSARPLAVSGRVPSVRVDSETRNSPARDTLVGFFYLFDGMQRKCYKTSTRLKNALAFFNHTFHLVLAKNVDTFVYEFMLQINQNKIV